MPHAEQHGMDGRNTKLEKKKGRLMYMLLMLLLMGYLNATTGRDLAVGRTGHARLKRRTKLRAEYGNRTRSSGTSRKI
jgi:hypothetical protein